MRYFDHGCAVTSHCSQGLTSRWVLVNIDTVAYTELINERFDYVSVSRTSHNVRVSTRDSANLSECLSKDVSKTSAIDPDWVSKSRLTRAAQEQR